MTKIDFYILPATSSEGRWDFVCRLVEKAVRLQHKVLVSVDTSTEAETLDNLLWTFKPESFIPHQCVPSSTDAKAGVEITCDLTSPPDMTQDQGLLINLSQKVPAYFSRFERLSEIVIQQPDVLKNTRDHYSFYRERGYPIQHRKM